MKRAAGDDTSRWIVGIGVVLLLAIILFAVLRAPWTTGVAVTYRDDVDHFKYGSIGSEVSSGIPYWAWQAMPRRFPEEFGGRTDYSAFGFVYERDASGRQRDLPIGISRRSYRGIDMVWFNCAVCHTGTWRPDAAARPNIVAGMPSNNLDFGGFIRFLLGKAAVDPRLAPAGLVSGSQAAGASFGPVNRLFWTNFVGPQLREGLLERRSLLVTLLESQPAWGPGRVDTFNPYKLLKFKMHFEALDPAERVGTSDFPSIFLQRPRQGMQLHWDGNNKSLMERNLSAAIGAGVSPETADIASIKRVANWLMDLAPPPSPLHPDGAAAQRGSAVYRQTCASCHGYRDGGSYVFSGANLGKVTPIQLIGTDRNRLDSYTSAFRMRQVTDIFKGTPYAFRYFTKTNGYSNQPLDALWLRAPYLHNGSVPTLADLLEPPERRPVSFIRGYDIIDYNRGGFIAPPCDPGVSLPLEPGRGRLICFDTRARGNGNGGHSGRPYGTDLPRSTKDDLLAYLKTF